MLPRVSTSNRQQKHVVIVGAGPGGLTTAMLLAKRGFRVTVFEKDDRVGGRNAGHLHGEWKAVRGECRRWRKMAQPFRWQLRGLRAERLSTTRRARSRLAAIKQTWVRSLPLPGRRTAGACGPPPDRAPCKAIFAPSRSGPAPAAGGMPVPAAVRGRKSSGCGRSGAYPRGPHR